jgi:hypothetical protein
MYIIILSLQGSILSLHGSIKASLTLHTWLQKDPLMQFSLRIGSSFHYIADPDPASQNNADPASKNNADPFGSGSATQG